LIEAALVPRPPQLGKAIVASVWWLIGWDILLKYRDDTESVAGRFSGLHS